MKKHLNTILLTFIILLCTIYYINCRTTIINKTEELDNLYTSIYNKVNLINSRIDGLSATESDVKSENYNNDAYQKDITPTPIVETPEQEVSGLGIGVVDGYYIMLKDNMIVVTESDKDTILENTGMTVEDLDESNIEELIEGIYIEDIDNMFNVLESLTS